MKLSKVNVPGSPVPHRVPGTGFARGRREQPTPHQDSYRRVLFGQASDPIFPPHPDPPEVTEAELAKQAGESTPIRGWRAHRSLSPPGRLMVLLIVAAIALGIVLWHWG